MATTERPYKPLPFLNWKGMRRWSVGRRAPALCRIFTKAESSSSLTSKLASLAAMAKLLRQATVPSSSSSVRPPPRAPPSISLSSSTRSAGYAAARAPPSPADQARSPAQARGSMHRCTSVSSNSSRLAGAAAMANCLRRHSDAIAPAAARVTASLSRFSIDSALPYYPASRPNNEETRPNISRLGTPSHERPTTTPSMSSSPIVARVKDTCAHLVHTAVRQSSTRHPLDLLVGNPFLTRLNPAPVSSALLHNTDHGSGPSSGLLNASKAKHSQLNDRLVFFL